MAGDDPLCDWEGEGICAGVHALFDVDRERAGLEDIAVEEGLGLKRESLSKVDRSNVFARVDYLSMNVVLRSCQPRRASIGCCYS